MQSSGTVTSKPTFDPPFVVRSVTSPPPDSSLSCSARAERVAAAFTCAASRLAAGVVRCSIGSQVLCCLPYL